jgi:hypothetical protein
MLHNRGKSLVNQGVWLFFSRLPSPSGLGLPDKQASLGGLLMPLAVSVKSTSTWFAFRNPVFCRLWLASVAAGTVVSAQDVVATWLMHDLGASSLALSLMATAASAPFFLFTLPAGAFADIVSRRSVIVWALLWQGLCATLLALGALKRVIDPNAVLACIFMLGIGLAFGAPVWGAIVPDVVSREGYGTEEHRRPPHQSCPDEGDEREEKKRPSFT